MGIRGGHRASRGELFWREVFERQSRSGESTEELCGKLGVSTNSYYNWRKRLKTERERPAREAPTFAELEVALVNECEIRLPGGRSIVVRAAVAPELLSSLISVVERR